MLLNETNLSYCYGITLLTYNLLGYNFPQIPSNSMDVDTNQNENVNLSNNKREIIVALNRDSNHETFDLNQFLSNADTKLRIIFSRYQKMFLVQYKSLRAPKNLKEKDYQQILKYL